MIDQSRSNPIERTETSGTAPSRDFGDQLSGANRQQASSVFQQENDRIQRSANLHNVPIDGLNGGSRAQLGENLLCQANSYNPFQTVSDAMAGNGNASRPGFNYMGSITQPRGMFAGTPDVSFTIDGKKVTLPIPSVSGGDSVRFYTNGTQIEARSGNHTWQLQYGYNRIISALGSGWHWTKK